MNVMTTFWLLMLPALALSQITDPQAADTVKRSIEPLPVLIPPMEYVMCGPSAGGTEKNPTSITLEEALQLKVTFLREKLPMNSGVQFLSVEVSYYHKDGTLKDKLLKHAFTFPKDERIESDAERLRFYSKNIVPYGFVSEKKIDGVRVVNDSVPGWTKIKIEVTPDEEYTKFAERFQHKLVWWYRVKGNQFEEEFFFGIPKVLYDTHRDDTINYGNASAMLRFYYLHAETGERYPVNFGIGTFGVSTPIDVSPGGGGFALSLLFDVIQAVRLMYGASVTSKVNAGIEITPFFPLERKARLLFNARIGFSP